MSIEVNESLFKELYPYMMDDNVTDVKWNGKRLWIDDLTKGRYPSEVILSDEFLDIFTQRIANEMNVNFSKSDQSLMAELDELRIHAVHPFVTGNKKCILAIRKTPAVARINNSSIIDTGYADKLFILLIKAMIRAHKSGIIIGDVGSGKTELEKFIAGFIPSNESVLTVEDTLEMKLDILYPEKDITPVKTSKNYTTEKAIRDALRLLTKWLLIAEARGREILRILEGASTGCVAWSTIHTNNVWEIPDRIVQMAGDEADPVALENDVYAFFDIGIKVAKNVSEDGISRRIDQICFFNRENKKNSVVIFMKNGKYTGEKIPDYLIDEFKENEETELINLLHELNLCEGSDISEN